MADKINLCEDCKKITGANRHASAHRNLKFTGGQRCSSMMGAADEGNYVCSECKAEWLHETGSCGMGWVR